MFHASSKRVEFSAFHNERLYMLEFGYLERLDHHSALRRPGGNLRRLIMFIYLYYSPRYPKITAWMNIMQHALAARAMLFSSSNRTLSLGDFVPFADAGTNQAWL